MAGGGNTQGSYSKASAFVFVFNLVVGVGALALPHAFVRAGLILGTLLLLVTGSIAFMTLTFVNEAMGAANALLNREDGENPSGIYAADPRRSTYAAANYLGPLNEYPRKSPYEITKRVEFGRMASLFLNRKLQTLFYVMMIVYLYGDLAIYAVAVPDTLAKFSGPVDLGGGIVFSAGEVYYFYLTIFSFVVVPFCFFDFSNTRLLQMATMAIRNIAFIIMIVLGFIYVGKGNGTPVKELPLFNFSALPGLFGTAVYSFMCHHSLPSIVTPIRDKRKLTRMFFVDYLLIASSYLMLCFSAVAAFADVPDETCSPHPSHPCHIQQLYTINFLSYDNKFIADYLSLFPVFTLTTNFPLICITLRNNLQALWASIQQSRTKRFGAFAELHEDDGEDETMPRSFRPSLGSVSSSEASRRSFIFRQSENRASRSGDDARQTLTDDAASVNARRLEEPRESFPKRCLGMCGSLFGCMRGNSVTLLACVPPILIAYATQDTAALVSYTGAIAGVFIQFVFPAILVSAVRKNPLVSRPALDVESLGFEALTESRPDHSLGVIGAAELDELASAPSDMPPSTLANGAHRKFSGEDDLFETDSSRINVHESPFRSRFWVWLVAIWSLFSLFLQVYNQACVRIDNCRVA